MLCLSVCCGVSMSSTPYASPLRQRLTPLYISSILIHTNTHTYMHAYIHTYINTCTTQSRDACLKEGEKDVREQYTFQPVLSAKVMREREVSRSSDSAMYAHTQRHPRSLSPQSHGQRGSVDRSRDYLTKASGARSGQNGSTSGSSNYRYSSGSARIDETILHREEAYKQRERVRKQAESLELSACTFQPKISKNADRIVNKKTNRDSKTSTSRNIDVRSQGGWGLDSSVESLNPFEDEIMREQDVSDKQHSHKPPAHAKEPKVSSAEGMHASNRLYQDHQIRQEQQKVLRARVGVERSNLYVYT